MMVVYRAPPLSSTSEHRWATCASQRLRGSRPSWRLVACSTQPHDPHWCPHALLLSPAVSVQVWPKATVQEGQLVNLTCLVWTAQPAQLTYTWYQDGQARPGAHSLQLPNVTVSDAAPYHCGVVAPGQAPRLSRPVILDVLCECGWWQGGAGRNDSSLQGSGDG